VEKRLSGYGDVQIGTSASIPIGKGIVPTFSDASLLLRGNPYWAYEFFELELAERKPPMGRGYSKFIAEFSFRHQRSGINVYKHPMKCEVFDNSSMTP
jgi:hypothetical protein